MIKPKDILEFHKSYLNWNEEEFTKKIEEHFNEDALDALFSQIQEAYGIEDEEEIEPLAQIFISGFLFSQFSDQKN